MKVHQLFSVPLLEFKHPDAESLCPELLSFFLAHETDQYRDDISRDTQAGALFESRFDLFYWKEREIQPMVEFIHRSLAGALFESRFDLFYWKEREIQPMVEFIHRSLARVVAELNQYSPEQMNALRFNYHAWYHVTRKGGFQSMHNHPNASWSGIFCVDPGKTCR